MSRIKAESAKDYLEEFCNPLTTFVNEERRSRGSVDTPGKREDEVSFVKFNFPPKESGGSEETGISSVLDAVSEAGSGKVGGIN